METGVFPLGLILEGDLLGFDDGVGDEGGGVEIGFFQGDGGDLVIIIAGVIKNAFFEIVTRGIDGVFVFVVAEIATAVLLVDGMEDVEELADAGGLVGLCGAGIELREGGFGEAGFGRKVTGEADGTHATAIDGEVISRSEVVFGGFGGKMLIVAELEDLFVKRWVVGQDADWVVINF